MQIETPGEAQPAQEPSTDHAPTSDEHHVHGEASSNIKSVFCVNDFTFTDLVKKHAFTQMAGTLSDCCTTRPKFHRTVYTNIPCIQQLLLLCILVHVIRKSDNATICSLDIGTCRQTSAGLTEVHRQALKEAFDGGLRSFGTTEQKTQVEGLAVQLNLTTKQVKVCFVEHPWPTKQHQWHYFIDFGFLQSNMRCYIL